MCHIRSKAEIALYQQCSHELDEDTMQELQTMAKRVLDAGAVSVNVLLPKFYRDVDFFYGA